MEGNVIYLPHIVILGGREKSLMNHKQKLQIRNFLEAENWEEL